MDRSENRKGKLTPFSREGEGNTLQLLETALLKPGQPANKVVLAQLQATGPRDVAELLPYLDKRGGEVAEGATRALIQRGEQEAQDMRTILTEQRDRILATAAKYRDKQPELFNQDEMLQLKADQRHWGRRLNDLERELTTEPNRIRNVYVVQARRIEPVGVVYLWPVTN